MEAMQYLMAFLNFHKHLKALKRQQLIVFQTFEVSTLSLCDSETWSPEKQSSACATREFSWKFSLSTCCFLFNGIASGFNAKMKSSLSKWQSHKNNLFTENLFSRKYSFMRSNQILLFEELITQLILECPHCGYWQWLAPGIESQDHWEVLKNQTAASAGRRSAETERGRE